MFGGLPVLATAGAIGAAMTPQEWDAPKIGVMVLMLATFWGIFAGFIWKRMKTRPTYQTDEGLSVWTNGLPISFQAVKSAIAFYVTELHASKVLKNSNALEIAEKLDALRIEFVEQRFTTIWYGKDKKYAGIQKGNFVKVAWLDGFDKNAFFHELHHYVDEVLRGSIDIRHEDDEWWALIPEMKHKWANGNG
jgi:hypothetical protein